ncbi:MAG: PEP-CTERM sorting domain-containing protein [Isosphaeraceae bacterium]
MNRPTFALTLILIAVAAGSARGDFTLLDDFNRPNSPTLGPNWTQQSGLIGVVNLGAVSQTGLQSDLATFDGRTAWAITMDVGPQATVETGGSYLAAVLGYKDLANNLFIKVQYSGLSGPGVFNSIAFGFGDNGSNNAAWSGATFAFLPAARQFTSARITAALVGTAALLLIDTDFDGVADQVYTAYDVPVARLGTGIGIGTFGNAQIRRFGIDVVSVPEPASIVLMAIAGLALAGVGVRRQVVRRRQVTPTLVP